MATLITQGRILCGFLESIVDLELVREAPQIHTHHLTEDDEQAIIGFRRLEICCHGCGKSKLILYTDLSATDKDRDAFVQDHFSCPDFGFEDWCPDVRLNCEVVDLRRVIPFSSGKKKKLLTRVPATVKNRPTSP